MKVENNAMAIDIKVPDIGDFKEVEVIEVLVKVGDTVVPEQSLITVESDKASMEIPCAVGGVIQSLTVKIGDKISEGSVLGQLLPTGGLSANASQTASAAPAPVTAAAPVVAPVLAAATAPAAPTRQELLVPDIGDFKEVEIIELLVKPGDTVVLEQSLITVESDKASMEIPSPLAGVIESLSVKLGDKVSKGSVLGWISSAAPAAVSGEAVAAVSAPASVGLSVGAAPVAPAVAVSASGNAPGAVTAAAQWVPPVVGDLINNDHIVKPHASPSVRKFARELGVDLTRVRGTGPKMRIVHSDVQSYVKSAVAQVVSGALAAPAATPVASGSGLNLLPWPKIDFSKFGPTESVALSRIKKLSGPNLHRNWVMIPHVTQFDEADITDLESFRKTANDLYAKQGVKFTMLAFVMKACVSVLKRLPSFNGSLDESGENLILKNYWNIGFAADTPQGLVVPVVKAADQKSVSQIAKELADLSAAARDGKLKGADMQGATFTISSLGGVGGTAFTPIINAPELAILGLSKSQMRPVWDGKQFVPRLMLPLSLSYDHRVIDGAQAARFTSELASVLADMRKTLL